MAEPTGWDTRKPLCGENDPYGRSDSANQYIRELYRRYRLGHTAAGAHDDLSAVLPSAVMRDGSYLGTGVAQAISLGESLQIQAIMIVGEGERWPVFRTRYADVAETVLSINSGFTDASSYGHPVSYQGYVSWVDRTTESADGNPAMQIDQNAVTSSLIIPASTAFTFEGDFYIAFEHYISIDTTMFLLGTALTDDGSIAIRKNSSDYYEVYLDGELALTSSSAWTDSGNVWRFVELRRVGNTVTLSIDGTEDGSVTDTTQYTSSLPVYVGKLDPVYAYLFMDGIIIQRTVLEDASAIDQSKAFGVAGPVENCITDISTAGQFSVGTNGRVNALDETYYYFVLGDA